VDKKEEFKEQHGTATDRINNLQNEHAHLMLRYRNLETEYNSLQDTKIQLNSTFVNFKDILLVMNDSNTDLRNRIDKSENCIGHLRESNATLLDAKGNFE
jgi:predicted  nucleic acid-binding Zn-ribbon protein